VRRRIAHSRSWKRSDACAFVPRDRVDPLEILNIDPRVEQEQIARVQHLRQVRDNALLRQRLAVLESVAKRAENIMPAILDAVRAYGTIGEIADVLRGVWGTYEEEGFTLS
jgi:methylmalonyl-CoA mutase N-terminal domain/subunit